MGDTSGRQLDRDSQPVRRPKPDKHAVDEQMCLERTALRASLTQTSISVVKQGVEKNGAIHKEHYESGEAETDNENVKKLRKLNPIVLVGSVDATPYQQVWYRAKFYKPFITAASQLLKAESKLDPATKKWFNELKPIIEAFAKMASYTGSEHSLKRKYHKDIWKLTKKYGSAKIYGSRGFFNFGLAFRRIVNIYPKLKNITEENVKIDDLPVEAIKLTVGTGRGKVGGKKDRHAYMIVKKVKPIKKKPVKQPKAAKKPMPKPKQTKPTAAAPKFGSKKFYELNEIKKPKIFTADLSKVEIWSEDPDYKSVVDGDFWKIKDLSGREREVRLGKLFAPKRGKISKLYIELTALSEAYDKWFFESMDPKAKKIRKMYFDIIIRLSEYSEKFDTQDVNLIIYYKKAVEMDMVRKSAVDKRSVLEFLIKATTYLKDNEPAEPDKWEKLLAKYKKELDKL